MADATDTRFLDGYLEALAFTDTDNPDSEIYGAALAPELESQAATDCETFQREAAELLSQAYARADYEPTQAGRDFWFTRNSHGAGFWDRGLGEIGDKLSDIARGFGNLDVYRGDDGQAYAA